MAKKKAPNPKNYSIRWRKQDEINLKKAISQFNKNVKELRKKSADKDYIPSMINYGGTKKLIQNRAEYNRVIKSLSRFEGSKAFKKVTLPSGEELTAWEKREISYQKGVAIRRLNKMVQSEKRRHYKNGTNRYKELKATLKSVEDVFNVSGKKFELAKARIENYGSQDYEIRIATLYKKHYLKMLRDYKQLKGYRQLRKKINEMNPIDFYEKIKKMEQGEYTKDITFMYDTTDYQEMFNLLLQEFGLDKYIEEFDVEEGE